ncbi:MAG: hypothetical protein ACI9R3_001546 [Verrucomicrobiales bacterium]|jgi:hypothetical protein
MATSRILIVTMLTLLGALKVSTAGQVVWGSERMAINVTSTNAQLDDGFRFELGGFVSGFQPSAGNAADWSKNWVTVGAAQYHSRSGAFAASTDVESSSAIDGVAYIWGFNDKNASKGAEWVLLTNSQWVFPAPSANIAPPLQWSTGTATEAVVGSVNAHSGVHLQTAAVSVTIQLGAQAWLSSYGLSDSSESQIWEKDTDNDGVSNLLEYATGTHPLVASSFSKETIYVDTYGESRAITLTFDKNPDAMVHYQIELSSDLNHWESGDDSIEVVSDHPDRMTVRDSLPLNGAGSRYFRLSVSLLP